MKSVVRFSEFSPSPLFLFFSCKRFKKKKKVAFFCISSLLRLMCLRLFFFFRGVASIFLFPLCAGLHTHTLLPHFLHQGACDCQIASLLWMEKKKQQPSETKYNSKKRGQIVSLFRQLEYVSRDFRKGEKERLGVWKRSGRKAEGERSVFSPLIKTIVRFALNKTKPNGT